MKLKKYLLLSLTMLAACSIFGFSFGGAKGYTSISPEEAKRLMDTETVTIVDVRQPAEYADGHIPGAILVPLDTIGPETPALLPDKQAALLLYCRSGARSKKAAQQLAKLGYTNIREFGGIIEWPYEIEK